MRKSILVLTAVLAILVSACASQNQQKDAAIGAAVGAGAGAIIGHQYGEGGRDKGALIGAAVGGATGLLYGQQEDAQQSGGQRQAPPPAQMGRPGGPGGSHPGGPAGGDDFRNPYRMPSPQYCRGQWVWDAPSGYWQCR